MLETSKVVVQVELTLRHQGELTPDELDEFVREHLFLNPESDDTKVEVYDNWIQFYF